MVKVERLGVVIEPQKGKSGEYCEGRTSEYAAFNAGAYFGGSIVHMLYRYSRNRLAAEYDPAEMSPYAEDCIAYAQLTPEGKLIRDFGKVIEPEHPFELAGCQDPRITPFEGRYYITYAAWDRGFAKADRNRLAFAVTDDFKTYTKLGIMDSPYWDKDHYLFPERVNGKLVLVHRIEPDIQMEFFDSVEDMLDRDFWKNYRKNDHTINIRRKYDWESHKIGGGVPPIRTDKGWLFLYHGVRWLDKEETRFEYCAGAALLDLNDPSKVLGRLPEPLFRPETDYEKHGDVENVVFPVGGYIYNGDLYISYGGADKVVAMVKCNLNELLGALLQNKDI